jgi:hypothetical protein
VTDTRAGPAGRSRGPSTLLRVAVGLALLALTMAVASWIRLASWRSHDTATPAGARAAHDGARAAAGATGDAAPYLEITPAGEVVVHRAQEQDEPVTLATLHVLAWQPSAQRLVRVDFPWWFVRLKLSRTVGLGTMVAAVAGDWEGLDLGVSEDELERRGPALLLDHARADGARIVLWTE